MMLTPREMEKLWIYVLADLARKRRDRGTLLNYAEAIALITEAILEGRPVRLFNEGNHSRDFTYVDDIVEGVIRASDQPAAPDPDWDAGAPDPATSNAPWRIFNIGNSRPVRLEDYVAALEEALGRKAKREYLPLQAGDVPDSFSDTSELEAAVGWRPGTPVKEGVRRFVEWYTEHVKR